jgi:hypothetical protein
VWSSPYINHFLQPDTIIPHPTNPQAWNRYSYVGNRPVNFSDPSGHKWQCTGPNSDHCFDDGQDQISGMVTLSPALTSHGRAAFHGLDNLQLLGKEQAAVAFVVDTEYGGTIQNPGLVYPLGKAMARRYHTYCGSEQGGAWSVSCLNGFWGYMQGVLDAADDPEGPLSKMSHHANVPMIASAVIGDTGLDDLGFTSDVYEGGCQDPQAEVLCGWAVINSSDNAGYYHAILPPNRDGGLYNDPTTNFRYVLEVDNSHLLVVLSPYQQSQDYFNFGNNDYDQNITHFK